jgi:hypothetical protein
MTPTYRLYEPLGWPTPDEWKGMTMLAYGILEWAFLGLLGLLVVVVGAFSVFLIANQFRNPGRKPRRL